MIEKLSSEYYYEQQGIFLQSKERSVSKEHIIVEKVLKKMLEDPEELKSEVSVDGLYSTDFFIPSKKAVIEINGDLHFYPYTTRFSNTFTLKQNLMRREGFKLINLNMSILKGLSKNPEKVENLIAKHFREFSEREQDRRERKVT